MDHFEHLHVFDCQVKLKTIVNFLVIMNISLTRVIFHFYPLWLSLFQKLNPKFNSCSEGAFLISMDSSPTFSYLPYAFLFPLFLAFLPFTMNFPLYHFANLNHYRRFLHQFFEFLLHSLQVWLS